MCRIRTLLVLLILWSPAAAQADSPALSERYAAVSQQIIEATLERNNAWDRLVELCDDIGHRLSGSEALNQAIAWALATLERDGHEAIRAEPVQVPRWVRGQESLALVEPRPQPMRMLGLGGSVGTPPEGITAEVEVVRNEEELEALGEGARGKIVLFDNPMPPYSETHGTQYGRTVRFRVNGARMAAAHGAVAVLVRSVTDYSLYTAHTGAMRYGDAERRIPAAAIATEDSSLIARLRTRGRRVVVTLKMEARDEGMVPSANVVAELRGSTLPDEVVVISGHLDSWDVGQGAHDDASGCVMAMEALSVLRRLNLRPKRTIRVVLWTNEENGLGGGRQYAKAHESEMPQHVAAIEADTGCFAPRGFSLDHADATQRAIGVAQLSDILKLLAPLDATRAWSGFAGADLIPMGSHGVPRLGLRMDVSTYFRYHHTHADTVEKIDPNHLTKNVAAMAVLAYILADMPTRLGVWEE